MGIGKAPKVIKQDPEADAALAAAKAAQAANADMALRKKQRKNSSLLAAGAGGTTGPATSVLASAIGGKETLGA